MSDLSPDHTCATAWYVPGRIEVLGKHTDYAGGNSLLAAVDRGVTVRGTALPADPEPADPNQGPVIRARSTALPGEYLLRAGQPLDAPEGHWAHYLQTVIDRLTANFGELAAADLTISSTLPLASGMSSSSALIVGMALALIDLNDIEQSPAWREAISDRIDLAGYAACIENGMSFKNLAGHRGVGTFGGSEDHTGMLCTAPDHLGLFSFCPITEQDQVAFPADLSFVVIVSGVSAEKTGAAKDAYTRVSLSMKDLVEQWNQATGRQDPVIADALASGYTDGERNALAILVELAAQDPYQAGRFAQFVDESTRIIPAAVQALAEGDLPRFGSLVDESMAGAVTGLGNQIPETIALARLAREHGALAASAFGAGFGGSVYALVPTTDAEQFADTWLKAYAHEFPEAAARATVLATRPDTPARRLQD